MTDGISPEEALEIYQSLYGVLCDGIGEQVVRSVSGLDPTHASTQGDPMGSLRTLIESTQRMFGATSVHNIIQLHVREAYPGTRCEEILQVLLALGTGRV